jgi:hypothetical protein
MHTTHTYLLQHVNGSAVNARSADDTVELMYSRADLATRTVVRNTALNKYMVFASAADMWAHVEAQPAHMRTFEEVIFGWAPQRLKFDIDAPCHAVDKVVLDDGVASATPAPPLCELDADLLEMFDIDISAAQVALTSEQLLEQKMRKIVGIVADAIIEELYSTYFAVEDIAPSRADIVVCEANGVTKGGDYKYSYHLIVKPYAVVDNEEARAFSERVFKRLPQSFTALRIVDPDVNKRVQNFRLTGSCKQGEDRPLVVNAATCIELGSAPATAAETLIIASRGMKVLTRVLTDENALQSRNRNNYLIGGLNAEQSLKQICKHVDDLGASRGHALRETLVIAGGIMLIYDRVHPSYCTICCEVHHKDNTLIIIVEHNARTYNAAASGCGSSGSTSATAKQLSPRIPTAEHAVTELCRHKRATPRALGSVQLIGGAVNGAAFGANAAANGARVELVREVVRKDMASRVAGRVAGINSGKVDPHKSCATQFEHLPANQKTVYDAPLLRPYEPVATLAVRAPMKMGKTTALREYLNTHYPLHGLRPATIRMVTFRQTFSNSLHERFPEFMLYNEVVGDLDHIRCPRLIVQVESLHRIPMPVNAEPVDLLVLDEVESIFAQFSSNLHKHFVPAFAMFQWMLRTATRVVCLDANLGDRTFRTLQRMRPDHPIQFHWNRHEGRAKSDEYFFTSNHAAWLNKLFSTLRSDCTAVIASNSLAEAETLHATISREFPDKRVGIYSSRTSAEEKSRHFADVHTYWSELDCLIYTPTVTAGVSYEKVHFDTLFGYFTDSSCDVETCRQMLGRVRNILSKEHFICLQGASRTLPVHTDEIARLVRDQRSGLYRAIDNTALQFSYGDNGNIVYYESDYFYMWVENSRMANLSLNKFIERFVDQVAETGATVQELALDDDMTLAHEILAEHKAMRAEMKEERQENVASAAPINYEEAHAIRDKLTRQLDVTDEERCSLERWQLAESYQWHGKPIDGEFVAKYSPSSARRVYRNLRLIASEDSVTTSLMAMRDREAAHYEFTMEQRVGNILPTLGWGARALTDPRLAALSAQINCSSVEGRDLQNENRTYVFYSHFLAIWLLQLCGFHCITDGAQVGEDALYVRLRASLKALNDAMPYITFTFKVNKANLDSVALVEKDKDAFMRRAMILINSVLRGMYGIEIKHHSKGNPNYVIKWSPVGRLFTFGAVGGDDALPHIHSNLKQCLVFGDVSHFLDFIHTELPDYSDDDEVAPAGSDPPQLLPAPEETVVDDTLYEEFMARLNEELAANRCDDAALDSSDMYKYYNETDAFMMSVYSQ